MARNDIFLIDGIIDDRIKNKIPSSDRGEVFELFAVEQLLKDYDLSQKQLLNNSVDGENDGGIDFIFYFVNGQLVSEPEDFIFPKSNVDFEVYIISCKHADSFKLDPVNALYSSISELYDLKIKTRDLKAEYNEDLRKKREDFLEIYKKTAICSVNHLYINVIYTCRGIQEELADNVSARASQLEHWISNAFSNCCTEFSFVGSSELLEKYRKTKKYDLDLSIEKILSKGSHSVVLSKLSDYYNFITDEDGNLRRYLFDSNVRDFMGLNRVNEDILETLNNCSSPDFWLLNNGITMLVSKQFPVGESITLTNIQIVNGLQTTLSIYNFFSSGGQDKNDRCVLIKIIKSDELDVRDSVIKATNNQTEITVSSLHATDKIQRDIEEILLKRKMYYERKVKYYENQGISPAEIITPLYLASAYVSLVLKLPYQAVSLKQKFMNNPEKYNLVFSAKTDLNIWPQLAMIYKKTDEYLFAKKSEDKYQKIERFKKFMRHPLAFFTLANKFSTYAFSVSQIIGLDVKTLSDEDFDIAWNVLNQFLDNKVAPKELASASYFIEIAKQFQEVKAIQSITRIKTTFKEYRQYELSEFFIDQVEENLPPQPWPVGVHRTVAQSLNCPPAKVYQAIDVLIERGKVYNQKDGVLYTKDGETIK